SSTRRQRTVTAPPSPTQPPQTSAAATTPHQATRAGAPAPRQSCILSTVARFDAVGRAWYPFSTMAPLLLSAPAAAQGTGSFDLLQLLLASSGVVRGVLFLLV